MVLFDIILPIIAAPKYKKAISPNNLVELPSGKNVIKCGCQYVSNALRKNPVEKTERNIHRMVVFLKTKVELFLTCCFIEICCFPSKLTVSDIKITDKTITVIVKITLTIIFKS